MSGAAAAAVVDVHAEHVADAVQGPARVDLRLGVERLLGRDRQQVEVLEPVREHRHRGVVGGQERLRPATRVDAGLLGGVDEVVEVALQRGERAVDRQRAGHVGGVEVAALDAHVEQHQLAGRRSGRCSRSSAASWRGRRRRRSSRSRCRCPSRGPGGGRCPRSSARRTRAPASTRAPSPRSRGR